MSETRDLKPYEREMVTAVSDLDSVSLITGPRREPRRQMKKTEEWVCGTSRGGKNMWGNAFRKKSIICMIDAYNFKPGTRLRVTAEVLEPEKEQEKEKGK